MVSNPPIMKFQRAIALSMSLLPIIANAQISDDVVPGQVVVKLVLLFPPLIKNLAPKK